MLTIRPEEKADYRRVEEITREAFWNRFVPGCDEHYLVHCMRGSADFIKELDFVAELDGRITGNIMYTRSCILQGSGAEFPAITFGPVSVLPPFQKRGIGSALIRHSLDAARRLGYRAVIIYGDPAYYRRFGFEACIKNKISNHEGRYPLAMQVLELESGALKGISGIFQESPLFVLDGEAAAEFDRTFPPKEKKEMPSQKEFIRIASAYWDSPGRAD